MKFMKNVVRILILSMALLVFASCGTNSSDPIAFTIEMEDGSIMKGELYPDVQQYRSGGRTERAGDPDP